MWEDYSDNYYEMSKVDELLKEFSDKCKEVLIDNVNSEIGAIKSDNEYLSAENKKLQKALKIAEKELGDIKKNDAGAQLMSSFIKNLDPSNDEQIYKFLSTMFESDYTESTYGVPLWLGAMTNYYSHKGEVLQLLKVIGCKLPDGVETFRLPCDWNDDELQIFLDTMYNHVNCNGCTYQDNLRFWSPTALDSVYYMCNKCYSEIPWQFVLRNPLLKQEKFLKQIGRHMLDKCNNWYCFNMIEEYLELTNDEIKIILDNLELQVWTKKNESVSKFILRHIDCVENEQFLSKIYEFYHDSYEFQYHNTIFKMPWKYVVRWFSEHKDKGMLMLNDKSVELTKEQRKELVATVLD